MYFKPSLTLLSLFIQLQALAQECDSRLGQEVNKDNLTVWTFKQAIGLNGEKGSTIQLMGMIEHKAVILVYTASMPRAQFPCIDHSATVKIEFGDGSSLKLRNAFDTNCTGNGAVIFSESKNNIEALHELTTKNILEMKVATRQGNVDVKFSTGQAAALRESLACLATKIDDYQMSADKPLAPRKIDSSGDGTTVQLEEVPEFPGGNSAMFEFIKSNLQFPSEALKKRIGGTVYVTFIVANDGRLIEPEILKSVSAELDAEALRVVSLMPPWSPGRALGKAVSVRFNLPIKFTFNR